VRKRIIDSVLATDMSKHFTQVSWFKTLISSNSIEDGKNIDQIFKDEESGVSKF
jgi:hypothetical protein